MVLRQLFAAMVRSAALNSTCTSFSASAKVEGETSGPTAGPAPKAGGAPGGRSKGCCAYARYAVAAAKRLRDVWVRNCLRDFDMNPPARIVIVERSRNCHGEDSERQRFSELIWPLTSGQPRSISMI